MEVESRQDVPSDQEAAGRRFYFARVGVYRGRGIRKHLRIIHNSKMPRLQEPTIKYF